MSFWKLLEKSYEARPKIHQDLHRFFWSHKFPQPLKCELMKITTFTVENNFDKFNNTIGVKNANLLAETVLGSIIMSDYMYDLYPLTVCTTLETRVFHTLQSNVMWRAEGFCIIFCI